MDDVAWGALAAALTLVGAAYTFWAFRSRGAAAGTRGLALTLLPAAAWLTGTLRMFSRIAGAVGDWATSLVLNPFVWLGTILFGASVVLWVVGGVLHGRNAKRVGDPAIPEAGKKPVDRSKRQPAVMDEDMAEIEAILRNRGIS